MQCPVCNIELRMSERQGVEIDYCPQCRGVWLDRGELDKIIERNGQEQQRGFGGGQRAEEPRYGTERREERPYPEPRPGHTSSQGGYPPYRKKKRESFLDDLFDFD